MSDHTTPVHMHYVNELRRSRREGFVWGLLIGAVVMGAACCWVTWPV